MSSSDDDSTPTGSNTPPSSRNFPEYPSGAMAPYGWIPVDREEPDLAWTCGGSRNYILANTPDGEGMGLFATHGIEVGSRIIQESALLRIDMPEGAIPEPLELYEAFRQLSRERQDKFMSLHCGGARLNEIFDRMLEDYPDMTHTDAKFRGLIATLMTLYTSNRFPEGVFFKASRLNHSCTPNCFASIDDATGKLAVRVIQPVRQGDELTIAYVPVLEDLETRWMNLRQWGFTCECNVCGGTRADAELSDVRRNRIQQLTLDIAHLGTRLQGLVDLPSTHAQGPFLNLNGTVDLFKAMEEFEELLALENLVTIESCLTFQFAIQAGVQFHKLKATTRLTNTVLYWMEKSLQIESTCRGMNSSVYLLGCTTLDMLKDELGYPYR